MQIAIDTSTDTAGLALTDNGRILAELTWNCGKNHTVQLLPNLNYLLEQNSLSLESADCIIVARGPGSYNGLRVGISTARGLAYSLGIPIVGISTLEAEAWQHAGTELPVCPILNAGREEVATATYRLTDAGWTQLEEEHLSTLDDLCSGIQTRTVFCGEYVYKIADELKSKLGDNAVIVSPFAGLRRPGFLAELGLKRIEAGDFDDTATLQPRYFRGPSITKPNPGKK
ncbi:MAG: tRNA (adenosine(37)-N6)-threonylcarbamoyltransferase complex dimerization subunit type 1 TsaB [Chloroflexi bacterium RBG_13_46_14]|nr:MAG: tRNA (adenosine(37)-N6)-threonylcarbamoyltransferase complex dimerization subunit type 1 TsaB [Chloroflexi bacterium RBG_13_46_14]